MSFVHSDEDNREIFRNVSFSSFVNLKKIVWYFVGMTYYFTSRAELINSHAVEVYKNGVRADSAAMPTAWELKKFGVPFFRKLILHSVLMTCRAF